MTRKAAVPYLNLLVTMIMFGGAFASSKVVVGQIPHEAAAAFRFGGGGLLLVALAAALRHRSAPIGRATAVRAGLIGLVGVLGYNILFFWGLSLAPSLDGSIIVPVLSPILTTITLIVVGREAVSRTTLAGLAVALAGAVIFFVSISGEGSGSSRLAGDLVFVAGAGFWAAYSILSQSLLSGIDPLRATAWGTGVGAVGLVVVAAPTYGDVAWHSVTRLVWANVVFLAVGPTALAYLFYYRGLRSVGPGTATIMMFTVPVFGVFFSTVFLRESFTVVQLIGTLIMLGGAISAVLGKRSAGRHPEPVPAPVLAGQPEGE
jgi:drug/metabolite transporter (DMT)-like permease